MALCVVMPVSGPITDAYDGDTLDYPPHVTLLYVGDDATPADAKIIAEEASRTVFPSQDGSFIHTEVAPTTRVFGPPEDPDACVVSLIPEPERTLLTSVRDDFLARLTRRGVTLPPDRFPTYEPHVTLGEYPRPTAMRRSLEQIPPSTRAVTIAVPLLMDEGVPVPLSAQRARAREIQELFNEEDHPRGSDGKFTSGDDDGDQATQEATGAPARSADEVRSWPKVPGPLGSQGGTWHRDPETGKTYLLKPTKSLDHAQNEIASGSVYRAAGVPFPNTFVLLDEAGTKSFTLSEKIEGLEQRSASWWNQHPEVQAEAAKNFGVDALLSHWDVHGLNADNTLVTPDGIPVRIESGGAMAYRAMGDPKDSFAPGKPWVEPQSMRTSEQGKAMYGQMTDKAAAASLMRAALIDLDDVRASWRDAGISDLTSQKWADTLRERQEQIPSLVTKLLEEPFALRTSPARAQRIIALVAAACHMPAGTPDGGQFVPCDTPGAVDESGQTPAIQTADADAAAQQAAANPGAGPIKSLLNSGPTKSQAVAYALNKLKNTPEGAKSVASAVNYGKQTVYAYPGSKFKELVVTPNPDGKGHLYELVPHGKLSTTLEPHAAVQEATSTEQMADTLAGKVADASYAAAAEAAALAASPTPSVPDASEKTLSYATDKTAFIQGVLADSKAGLIPPAAAAGLMTLLAYGAPQGELAAVATGQASFSANTWEFVAAQVADGTLSLEAASTLVGEQFKLAGVDLGAITSAQYFSTNLSNVLASLTPDAPPYATGVLNGPASGIITATVVPSEAQTPTLSAHTYAMAGESVYSLLIVSEDNGTISTAAGGGYGQLVSEDADALFTPLAIAAVVNDEATFNQDQWNQVAVMLADGEISENRVIAMFADQYFGGSTLEAGEWLANFGGTLVQALPDAAESVMNGDMGHFPPAPWDPSVPAEFPGTPEPSIMPTGTSPEAAALGSFTAFTGYLDDKFGAGSSVNDAYSVLSTNLGTVPIAQVLLGEREFTPKEWATIKEMYVNGSLTVVEGMSILADRYPPTDPTVLIDMAASGLNTWTELEEFAQATHNELGPGAAGGYPNASFYVTDDPGNMAFFEQVQEAMTFGAIPVGTAGGFQKLWDLANDPDAPAPEPLAVAAAWTGEAMFNLEQWDTIDEMRMGGILTDDEVAGLLAYQLAGGQEAPEGYIASNADAFVEQLEAGLTPSSIVLEAQANAETPIPPEFDAGAGLPGQTPLELQSVGPIDFTPPAPKDFYAGPTKAAGGLTALTYDHLIANSAGNKILTDALESAKHGAMISPVAWSMLHGALQSDLIDYDQVASILNHQNVQGYEDTYTSVEQTLEQLAFASEPAQDAGQNFPSTGVTFAPPSAEAQELASDITKLSVAVSGKYGFLQDGYAALLDPSSGIPPVVIAAAVLGESKFNGNATLKMLTAYEQGKLTPQTLAAVISDQHKLTASERVAVYEILAAGFDDYDKVGSFNEALAKAAEIATDAGNMPPTFGAKPPGVGDDKVPGPLAKAASAAYTTVATEYTTDKSVVEALKGGALTTQGWAAVHNALVDGKITSGQANDIVHHQLGGATIVPNLDVQSVLFDLQHSIYPMGAVLPPMQAGVSQAQAALNTTSNAAGDLQAKLDAHDVSPWTNYKNAVETQAASLDLYAPDVASALETLGTHHSGAATLATGGTMNDEQFIKTMDTLIHSSELHTQDVIALTALQYGVASGQVWANAGLDPNDPNPLDNLDKLNLMQATASQSFTTNALGGKVYGDPKSGIVEDWNPKTGVGKFPTYAVKPTSEARQLIAQVKKGAATTEWHGKDANGFPTSKFQVGNTVLTLNAAGAVVEKLSELDRNGATKIWQAPPPMQMNVDYQALGNTKMMSSEDFLKFTPPPTPAPQPAPSPVPVVGQQVSKEGAGVMPKPGSYQTKDAFGKSLKAGSREYKRLALLNQNIGNAKFVKHVNGPLTDADRKAIESAKYGTSKAPDIAVSGYSRYVMHDGVLTILKGINPHGQETTRVVYTFGEKNYQTSGWSKVVVSDEQKVALAQQTTATGKTIAPQITPIPQGGVFLGDQPTNNATVPRAQGHSAVEAWGNKAFGTAGGKPRYTASEWSALYKYGDGHYSTVNGALRSAKGDLSKVTTGNSMIQSLDSALMRQRTPEAVVTYRGGLGSYEQKIREMPVGSIMRDQGYQSTSIGGGWGSHGLQMRIEVPAGTPAAWKPGNAHPGEQELLLPRGTILVKTGEVFQENGQWVAPMKLVAIQADVLDVQEALGLQGGTVVGAAAMLRRLLEEVRAA